MGTLRLLAIPKGAYMDGKGKLRVTYPVDWDATLKEWYDDPRMAKERKVIRRTLDNMLTIAYDKGKARYANQRFYKYHAPRSLRTRVLRGHESGELTNYGRLDYFHEHQEGA